jgi:hypothetical protein
MSRRRLLTTVAVCLMLAGGGMAAATAAEAVRLAYRFQKGDRIDMAVAHSPRPR